MKKLLVTLAAVLVSVSSFAQGTVVFHNRGLTGATAGTTYNARIEGVTDPAAASAQLFLVGAGGALTALTPVQTFRPSPNQQFFVNPVTVTVPGVAPGTTGQRFVIRAWQGGTSFDTATLKGESNIITVGNPLGGDPGTGAPPFTPPDLGGPNGLSTAGFALVPEPSTMALGLLGAAALLFRRRK